MTDVSDTRRAISAINEGFEQAFDILGGRITQGNLRKLAEWTDTPAASAFLDAVLGMLSTTGLSYKEFEDDFDKKLRHNVPVLLKQAEAVFGTGPNHSLIKGDNLAALAALRPLLAGKVAVITVDPPYATSNPQSYQDYFTKASWITFMTLRLRLAKDMLAADGGMSIHIDDNMYAYLSVLVDTIFGSAQNVATFIWEKRDGGGNDSTHVSTGHEYVLLIAKDATKLALTRQAYGGELLRRYKEEDEVGRFYWDSFARKSAKSVYPIEFPDGRVVTRSWLRKKDSFERDLKTGEVAFRQSNGKWVLSFKQRLPKRGLVPRSILPDAVGTTMTGGTDYRRVLGTDAPDFDYPKPVALIKHFIKLLSSTDSLVLDFFAGSGTTLQAVTELNDEDGGSRRCILVTDQGLASEEGLSRARTASQKKKAVRIADVVTERRAREVLSGRGWTDGEVHEPVGALSVFEVDFVPAYGKELVGYTADLSPVYSEDEVFLGSGALESAMAPYVAPLIQAATGAVLVFDDEQFKLYQNDETTFLLPVSNLALESASAMARLRSALSDSGLLTIVPVSAGKFAWMEELARSYTCRIANVSATMVRDWHTYNLSRKD